MKFWAIVVIGSFGPSAVMGDTPSDGYEYYGGYDSPSWHSQPSPVSRTQSQIPHSNIAIALTVSVRTYKNEVTK